MMQRLMFRGAILLCLGVAGALAADVAGKWTLSQQGLNGGPPHVTTLEFKVDGGTLTGTVTAPMGGRGAATGTPVDITNGKVNGSTVRFEVIREFAGKPVTTKYEGTVDGDTMHVKQSIDLGNGVKTVAVDAKRVAP